MTKRDACALWPLLVPVACGLMRVADTVGMPPHWSLLAALVGVCVGAVMASWLMWRTL